MHIIIPIHTTIPTIVGIFVINIPKMVIKDQQNQYHNAYDTNIITRNEFPTCCGHDLDYEGIHVLHMNYYLINLFK